MKLLIAKTSAKSIGCPFRPRLSFCRCREKYSIFEGIYTIPTSIVFRILLFSPKKVVDFWEKYSYNNFGLVSLDKSVLKGGQHCG